MNGVQTYRYPRLIHVFDKLGMIENFGTGIPRTIESYKNYDVKPEFKATENFFFVTLPNINYTSSGSINDSINDIGLEILKAVSKFPGISAPKITFQIKKYDSSITLYKIKNEIRRNLGNYIEHRGSNKAGGYYLKSKNK